jgi:hypothetical protein
MVLAVTILALSTAVAADTTWIYEIEGADTVAAERYWDTADGVRGHIVVRRPELREASYTIRTEPGRLPSGVSLEWVRHDAEGTQVEASFSANLMDGVVRLTDSAGNAVGEYPAPEDAVPMTGRRPIAYGMLHVLARATPEDGERTVHLLLAGQPDPVEAKLVRDGDTFRVETRDLRIEATLENGVLRSVTARVIQGGTLRTVRAERTSRFDPGRFLTPAG